MAAELITKGRQQLFCEVVFTARTESFIERGTEDGSGNRLVDSGGDGPAPFPESDTRPANFSRSGLSSREIAARSSSHEEMTLPRRQTSAMSAIFRSYR